MKGEIVMIKAKLFIETNDKIFNPHASIDVELQFIPMRSSLFYLAENHKKALEKKMSQHSDEFKEYSNEHNDMYIGDVIYAREIAMCSDGSIWISLSVDKNV